MKIRRITGSILIIFIAILCIYVTFIIYYMRPWIPAGREYVMSEVEIDKNKKILQKQWKGEGLGDGFYVTIEIIEENTKKWLLLGCNDFYWTSCKVILSSDNKHALVYKNGNIYCVIDIEADTGIFGSGNVVKMTQSSKTGYIPINTNK